MSRENTAAATVTGSVGRQITADELLLMGEGRRELIRGEVIELMPPGERHGKVAGRLFRHMSNYVAEHKLGEAYTETGFLLKRDPDTVRAPDAAFVARERVIETEKYAPLAPDLAVEVKSPSDTYEELQAKARFWLDHGVRMVWVALPETRVVEVHEKGQAKGKTPVQLSESDTISGGDVLPGFRLAVRECFSTGT